MTNLGAIIKEARQKKGMTLKQLGQKTDLTDTYLSFIERNKRNPSKKVLLKLSKVLDIEFAELISASMGLKQQNEQEKINKALDDYIDSFGLEKSEELELYSELTSRHKKLETFLKHENIYYKNIRLSEKDKKKILKMLDILFEEFDEMESNYPTIEEFKVILQEQKERELKEQKEELLFELLEGGEITQEEYENFNLDDIEFEDEWLNL